MVRHLTEAMKAEIIAQHDIDNLLSSLSPYVKAEDAELERKEFLLTVVRRINEYLKDK